MLQYTYRFAVWLAAFALLAGTLQGCAPGYGVSRVNLDIRSKTLNLNALNSPSPSEITLLVLKQRDLINSWRTDRETVYKTIKAEYDQSKDRSLLFALIELSYSWAKSERSKSEAEAKYLMTSAVLAFDYLFDENLSPPPSLFEKQSRLACQFYNSSLTQLAINIKARGLNFSPGSEHALVDGKLRIVTHQSELPWQAKEYSEMFVADQFKVKGLNEEYGTSGLGVPLILIRNVSQDDKEHAQLRYLPPLKQSFGASAFLRVAPVFLTETKGSETIRNASLELYDPTKTFEINVRNRHVPLRTNLTTPLAYMMEINTPPSGLQGMLWPEEWKQRQGLHMLQPYEKNKIPVVLVHGLMSSPATWLPMLNTLMGDPVIRKHYQFWFYMYPTGNPVLYSASLLRGSLQEAQEVFDPEHTSDTFNNMVLIGHSMGGLLSRAMAQDSGDSLYKIVSDVPVDKLPLNAEDKNFIKNIFFFKPLPFVKRILFLAVPHRGSTLADSTIGRLGAYLITLPLQLVKTSLSIVAKLQQLGSADAHHAGILNKLDHAPTGIDALSPNNKALITGANLLVRVPHHSIIGNNKEAGVPGTDGIVPYESAHLEDAKSELIVHSGHSVQEQPLTVREVRRILLSHIGVE